MSPHCELLRALLPEFCRSDADAQSVLDAAAAIGVDPLDYCAHRYGLGHRLVMERAAAWAELPFTASIPMLRITRPRRVESLGRARDITGWIGNREITFRAPRFIDVLALRAFRLTHPDFRSHNCLAPAPAIRDAAARAGEAELLDHALNGLRLRWPLASANGDLGQLARLAFVGVALGLAVLALLAPLLLQGVLLPLLGIILIVPALFRLAAIALHKWAPMPILPPPPLAAGELPIYTILVPLYDEAEMVPQLARALRSLDYPPEKLDIRFVVEARSTETIAAVSEVLDDPRFEMTVVPDAAPRTKPKALDYALPFARGAHIVVYDAEDIPNSDQLRLAAAAFAADPSVDCLQAELLIDNARENPLTGLFTGEYAGQFGIILPALARWNLPMPLGGTSNHFRTDSLREMGGWDAFNVTEDADLGVRLSRLRYRTGMLYSQTWEEAPVDIWGWMRQRTRWMKGWMQTYIVHNHHPVALWRDIGWRGFLAFQIYVGSMILSPLLHTLFLGSLLYRYTFAEPLFDLSDPQTLAQLAMLVIGYGGSIALVIVGLLRLGQKRLLAAQLLLPLYWVLHSVATLRAAFELIIRPHYWAKTRHGLTRFERSFAAAPVLLETEEMDAFESDLEAQGR